MGERKVLNKYYPPDFDPAKIPRRRQPKNQQMKVRTMLSMTLRCKTCGNFMYKGTKFNARKEDVVDETYLGIQVYRFYFKCSRCSAEITFKSDYQNSDYVVESGATRNYEPWRAEDEETEKQKQQRDAEEMGDAMKLLENRTKDSKREMDILAAVDEIKSIKSRQSLVSIEDVLEACNRLNAEKTKKFEEAKRLEEEEEEEKVMLRYREQKAELLSKRKRILDEDLEDYDDLMFKTSDLNSKAQKTDEEQVVAKQGSKRTGPSLYKPNCGILVIKKKTLCPPSDSTAATTTKKQNTAAAAAALSGLQSLYGSDKDDDDDE